MRGIRKVFPGVVANEGVDLDLFAGEILALLGENGAGKSTLMSVLMGIYRPDAGETRVRGDPVLRYSPRTARRLGLGMVHQHFVQSERHTALDNIVLGHPDLPFWPRRRALRDRVAEAACRYGLEVDLDAPLHALPVGERQKVEIVRALFHGARILVMDEPTAVLSRPETRALFAVLRRFAEAGGAVVFISHKLDEVLEIAHRVAVLRQGRNAGTAPVAGLDAGTLARWMMGRELELRRREPRPPGGEVVAQVEGVTVAGPRGVSALQGVDLVVHAGEVLGLAGVAGSGQRALADLLAGLAAPASGRVLIDRRELAPDPAAFRDAGVAYVPEDRLGTGLATALSVTDNLVLKNVGRFCRGGLVRWGAARAWAAGEIARHDVRCTGPRARVGALSGGNQQKLVVARELSTDPAPRLVVAAYPCRGLDVGAAEAVRAALLEAAGRGAAVVLLSEDLDEILRLSDRVGVLFRGRLLAVLAAAEATRERVGLLMGGVA